MKKKKAHHNKKVAHSRGDNWKKNLIEGRGHVANNPSKMRLERLNKRSSQDDVAKEVNLSRSTYMAVEGRKRMVKQDVALKIAEYFDVGLLILFKKCLKGKYIAKEPLRR